MALMAHDSDPKARKHALFTLKVGVKQYSLISHVKKVGSIDPFDPMLPRSMDGNIQERM